MRTLYLGLREEPPGDDEVDAIVDKFVSAVQEVFPGCCIRFEDWKGTEINTLPAKPQLGKGLSPRMPARECSDETREPGRITRTLLRNAGAHMSGLNKVTLIGHLGADPETRRLNSGDPVVTMRTACAIPVPS